MAVKHENNGACLRCEWIARRYRGFDAQLWAWFQALQKAHPEAHISCAGRGRDDQEEAKIRGASRAGFGESAHNYNAALDIFEQQGERTNIYEREWFDRVVAPAVRRCAWLNWYGEPDADFPELPHVELAGWPVLVDAGSLTLVE